jgi:hypothetical protein
VPRRRTGGTSAGRRSCPRRWHRRRHRSAAVRACTGPCPFAAGRSGADSIEWVQPCGLVRCSMSALSTSRRLRSPRLPQPRGANIQPDTYSGSDRCAVRCASKRGWRPASEHTDAVLPLLASVLLAEPRATSTARVVGGLSLFRLAGQNRQLGTKMRRKRLCRAVAQAMRGAGCLNRRSLGVSGLFPMPQHSAKQVDLEELTKPQGHVLGPIRRQPPEETTYIHRPRRAPLGAGSYRSDQRGRRFHWRS